MVGGAGYGVKNKTKKNPNKANQTRIGNRERNSLLGDKGTEEEPSLIILI